MNYHLKLTPERVNVFHNLPIPVSKCALKPNPTTIKWFQTCAQQQQQLGVLKNLPQQLCASKPTPTNNSALKNLIPTTMMCVSNLCPTTTQCA